MGNLTAAKYPRFACLSAFWLKTIALAAMVLDHIGYTGLSGLWWLRLVGRAAFPIYVFLLVEGFYHTKSVAKYALRLLVFALISELPFNYMSNSGASFSNPGSQNVVFTLLIGLGLLCALDWIKRTFIIDAVKNGAARYGCYAAAAVLFAVATAAACLLADALKADYKSWGVLLTAFFWLSRGCLPLYAASEIGVFSFIMPRYERQIPLFGGFTAGYYGFAILSMIPIALYNGKSGCKSRALQYAFYAAYPAHMLLLGWLAARQFAL